MPSPELSIVVASVQSAGWVAGCIEAIGASCVGIDVQIVVVEAGNDVETRRVVATTPGATLISLEKDALTPRLWSEGIAVSTGNVIALTTAQFRVSREWATSAIRSLETGASAVGGPLTLSSAASSLDAAVFFLRYSAFIDGTSDGDVKDIAGDNAAYRRDCIPDQSWDRASGFWELDVNRAILNEGGSIVWNGNMSAQFQTSYPLQPLLQHRFEHGRLFGQSRVHRGERAAAIALKAPLVPALLMGRIAKRVAARRDYRIRFAAALPLIFVLATAWAAGEAKGAIEGQRAHRS